jgi:hypothetical protein
MRAFHLVYLPLFIFCGWLVEDWWSRAHTGYRTGAVLLVAALLMPVSKMEYAVRWVKYHGAVPKKKSLEFDADFVAACKWIRETTSLADTFVVPSGWLLFAVLAQRSMVGSLKESSFIIYEPAVGVKAYERYHAVEAAYASPSPARLIEVARRYDAQYILVYDRELEGRPVFQSGSYRIYAVEPGATPSTPQSP